MLAIPLILFAIPCAAFFVGSMIPQMYIVPWEMQHKTHTHLERYFQQMQYKEKSWGGESKKYSKMIFKGAENWSRRASHRTIYIIYEIMKIFPLHTPCKNFCSLFTRAELQLQNSSKWFLWGKPGMETCK